MHQRQSLNLTSWTLLVPLEVCQCKIYYCTRVKLKFLRVNIESLTMASQEPPKKKSNQVENEQGTLLSWIKPCTSDTETGVVEETIRIKEQPGRYCRQSSDLTFTKKYALTVGPKQEGGLMWGTRSAPPVILFLLRACITSLYGTFSNSLIIH